MPITGSAMPFNGPPPGSLNVNSPNIGNAHIYPNSGNAHIYSSGMTFSGGSTVVAKKDETIEWAKFCMWLRGFLQAVEGKELTAEDTAKIMEKLATVDPDSQNWSYDKPMWPAQPLQPHPQPGVVPNPFVMNTPIGAPPIWTYQGSTTDGTQLDPQTPATSSGTAIHAK